MFSSSLLHIILLCFPLSTVTSEETKCGEYSNTVQTHASSGPTCLCEPVARCQGKKCFNTTIRGSSKTRAGFQTGDIGYRPNQCEDCKCVKTTSSFDPIQCPENTITQLSHCVCKEGYHCHEAQGAQGACVLFDDQYERVVASGFHQGSSNIASCEKESAEKLKYVERLSNALFTIENGHEIILKLINDLERNNFKIFIYPFCPQKGNDPWVDTLKLSREEFWETHVDVDCMEAHLKRRLGDVEADTNTYAVMQVFMHHLLHSPFYTRSWEEATFLVVPTIVPSRGPWFETMPHVIFSDIYNKTKGRNHIWASQGDLPWRCRTNARISKEMIKILSKQPTRHELDSRFIVLSFGGRVADFGYCHSYSKSLCSASCYPSDNHDIVIPSWIPRGNYRNTEEIKHISHCTLYRPDNLFFTMNPKGMSRRPERVVLMNYLKKQHFEVKTRSNESYFGLAPAGVGIWSARVFQLLGQCIVPVLTTDGVILPYERILDYTKFTTKILSTEYLQTGRHIMDTVVNMSSALRKCHSDKRMQDQEGQYHRKLCEDEAEKLREKLYRAKLIFPWLSWQSRAHGDDVRSPFTLTLLELMCKTPEKFKFKHYEEYCKLPTSRIATLDYN
eukprot:m.348041 g.348041  ORF g.348041 m.348041 type:complete len:617 (+) comp35315_c0_seq1:234-2084(+)